MEIRTKFYKISSVEKIFFKLSIITICTIVGNIYWVMLFIFYEESFVLPKFWIVINIIVLLIFGGILIKKLKLNYRTILAAGFFTFLLFPIFWLLLPAKIPQEYIGLRKTNNDGYIVADEYCKRDCNATKRLIKQDYYEERKFYSWRYAELLGRIPSDDICCYNQPFDSEYFFGILILIELTFEYFPLIFILTLLITIFEYYKRKDLDVFGQDFISMDEFDIRKINVFGLAIVIAITLYNIGYMNSI